MNNKANIGKTITIVLISFGVILLAVYIGIAIGDKNQITGSVISDLNDSEEIEEVNEEPEPQDDFSNIEEPHWGHMPITYKFETNCIEDLEKRIRLAFDKIKEETSNVVKFKEVPNSPDISIYCNLYKSNYTTNPSGEILATTITYADALPLVSPSDPSLIVSGELNFYGYGVVCSTGYPETEVHEILHLFGFGHDYGIKSIMRPEPAETSTECKIEKIDDKYLLCLKTMYSERTYGRGCSEVSFFI